MELQHTKSQVVAGAGSAGPSPRLASRLCIFQADERMRHCRGDMTEALLFDFNGVIADDEEQHREALNAVLAEGGISLTREQYYSEYLGRDDRTSLMEAFRRAGRPLATVRLERLDRKSTRLNSSHVRISYAVFCLKKKNIKNHARLVHR